MKNSIKFFALVFVLSFYFTGCYTIVWDPNEEFNYSDNSSGSSSFYDEDYYGSYVDYYDIPWWISYPVYITQPGGTTISNSITKDRTNGNDNRNSGTETIRNGGNGRGNSDSNSGTHPVIITNPPTTSGSGNTNEIINTPPPTRNTDSGNTSTTNSSTSSSNTRNSGSNDTRNNSGTRNSGNGRR